MESSLFAQNLRGGRKKRERERESCTLTRTPNPRPHPTVGSDLAPIDSSSTRDQNQNNDDVVDVYGETGMTRHGRHCCPRELIDVHCQNATHGDEFTLSRSGRPGRGRGAGPTCPGPCRQASFHQRMHLGKKKCLWLFLPFLLFLNWTVLPFILYHLAFYIAFIKVGS